MAAQKSRPAKRAAAKKTAKKSPRATAPVAALGMGKAQERQWQRESDLRTLKEAAEIQANRSRMAGAKSEANAQSKALQKIGGK